MSTEANYCLVIARCHNKQPVVVTVAKSGLICMCRCKVGCWSICRGLGVGIGAFSPRIGGRGPGTLRPGCGWGQAHCAPVGDGAEHTAPRLGTGAILLIPSRGSYQNFCPSYFRGLDGKMLSQVLALALFPCACTGTPHPSRNSCCWGGVCMQLWPGHKDRDSNGRHHPTWVEAGLVEVIEEGHWRRQSQCYHPSFQVPHGSQPHYRSPFQANVPSHVHTRLCCWP